MHTVARKSSGGVPPVGARSARQVTASVTGVRAGAWSAALLTIVAGLAACQSAARPAVHALRTSSGAPHSPDAPAAPRRTGSPPGAGASTDLRACYEGKCRIEVALPAAIPVDPRFGFSSVRATASGPGSVTVAAATPGGWLDDTVTVPGTAALNNLSIDIQAISGSNVTLAFSP